MKRVLDLKSIVFSVVMLCICAGCTNKNSIGEVVKIFDLESILNNIETVNLSDYASDINYYPLETSESSLVNGSIVLLNIVPCKDGVVIFSGNSTTPPLVFDNEGRFVAEIGTVGRTSNECVLICNVIPGEDGIEVVDYNKVMRYDSEYNFAGSFPILHNRGNICKMESGNYISLLRDQMRNLYVSVLDKEGNELKRVVEESAMTVQQKAPGSFDHSKGTVTTGFAVVREFIKFFSANGKPYILYDRKDTLYSVTEDMELRPEYAVNFGKYDEGVDLNSFIFETDKFIMSRFLFNYYLYPSISKEYRFLYFVYNKENGSLKGIAVDPEIGEAAFNNDLDGGISFFPKAVAGGKMYTLVSAITFMDEAEKCNSPRMKEVAATLNEESNPVLVVATLK